MDAESDLNAAPTFRRRMVERDQWPIRNLPSRFGIVDRAKSSYQRYHFGSTSKETALEIVMGAIVGVVVLVIGALGKWARFRHGERRNQRERAHRDHRNAQRSAIVKRGLPDRTLTELYGNRLTDDLAMFTVTVDGQTIASALATRPSWLNLQARLDTESCKLSSAPAISPEHQLQDIEPMHVKKLRERLKQLQPKMWQADIYRLTHVDISDDHIVAEFAISDFMSHMDVNGLISLETEEALIDAGLDVKEVVRRADRVLPIREAVMGSGGQIEDLTSRLCAVGVSVLFATARPSPHNDYVFYTVRRSTRVALGPGMLAPVPQGIHQPLDDRFNNSSISDTVYRELYEELFRGKEVMHGGRQFHHRWFLDQSPALRWIHDNAKKCTQEIICCGYNLMTGNCEFGVLIAIHDPTFWITFESEMATNWESTVYGVYSTKDAERITDLLLNPELVREGRAVVVEGLQRLREIDGSRVALPSIPCESLFSTPTIIIGDRLRSSLHYGA